MNNSAFTFQTLHPDIIMDALLEYGIRVDPGLAPFNSYENRVYQFQDENRRRFVVKSYHPERWAADQILEEHQSALQLVNDEVPVAAPVAFNGQTLLNHQGFYFAAFPSVGGRQFGTDNIGQMEAAGRYLGRMHQTGRKQLSIHRPTIGLNGHLIESRKLFEGATLMPFGLKTALLKATDELIVVVTTYWWEGLTVLRPHGDCYVGNILWRDGLMFVGLDDARNGPAIQDLWMLFNGDKVERQIQLKTIIEVYEEFSEFNTVETGLVEPLRATCLAYHLAWLMRRWADPVFLKNSPWLIGEDYWLRQTVTFIEQVKVLQEPPLQLTPMY